MCTSWFHEPSFRVGTATDEAFEVRCTVHLDARQTEQREQTHTKEIAVATATESDIKQLNSFLRGELSAVETYDQCISKIEKNSQIVGTLQDARNSHWRRAELLQARVAELGGKPAQSSGAWGGFAKLVEGGAKVFGESAAVAALEEGEDHGRDDYKRELKDVTPETGTFIRTQLLPAQMQTHDALSRLKKTVH